MTQDHLTDDFNRSAGSRRMCSGMPSQVMWPQPALPALARHPRERLSRSPTRSGPGVRPHSNMISFGGSLDSCPPIPAFRQNRSGPGMNTDQITCFHNDCPCSLVGQRKDSFIWSDSFLLDIFFELVGDLLRDKDDLHLFPAFGVSEGQFSTVNIVGGELEHLADSHPTTGHKFQHQTVSWIRCSEDDFVNNLLFQPALVHTCLQ